MPQVRLDWLRLVMLLGAIQGLLLTTVLATKRQNQTANHLLAGAILAFTIYLIGSVYYATGLVGVFPQFFGVSYPMLFLFGPLVYLYALTASDRSRQLKRADALHFVPFVLIVLFELPIYLMTVADKLALFEALSNGARPLFVRITNPLMIASGVSYTAATLLLLRRHARRIKDSYSHIERVNLRWLLWLGGSAAAIWLFAFVIQLIESVTGLHIDRSDDIISLAIAVLVYAIGYLGLRQPEVFQFAASDEVPAESKVDEPRYERSGLSDWEATSLKQKLLAAMETRQPWRDSELTLADLAAMLSTSPHKISEVLNSHVGQTFYDFVNGYRVRAVQQRLSDDTAKPGKLLAVAMDAGFASKSTFNEVFKKHTGKTPSAYRRTPAQ